MRARTMVLLIIILILAISAIVPTLFMERQLATQNSLSTVSSQSSLHHSIFQEILPVEQIPNPRHVNRTNSLIPSSHEVNVQAGYSSEPAPVGIADYGVSSSGAYEYASNSSLGVIVINSLATSCSSCNGYTNWMTFQLNVNLQFVAGGNTYVYWIQDVAQVDTSLRYIDFIDNVWNMSSPSFNMTSNGISGSGVVALSGTTGFYYAYASSSDPGNDVYLTYPSTVEFEVNSSINTSGKPTVAFAYNDGFGWITYDIVAFTVVSSLTSMSGFVVDGFQYNPYGTFYDAELTMGGPGGGTQTNDTQSNAQLMLEYWNGHNYQMITNAYNYGSDTAEGITNATDAAYYFTNNGTLFADVQAGAGSLAKLYDQSHIGVVSISSTLASGTLTWGNASMTSPGLADVSFVDNEVNVTVIPGSWLMQVYAGTVLYGSDDVSLTAGGDLKFSTTTSTVSCFVSALTNGSGTKCTASVLGSSPTGTVTWSQSSSNGGFVSFGTSTCTLSSGGCSVNLTSTSPGKVDISATYSGDTSNWASSGSFNLTVSELSGIVDAIDYPIYNGLNVNASRTITVTNPTGNSGLSSLTISIPAGATSLTPTGSCPSDSGVPGGCSVTVFGSGPWAIVYSTTGSTLVPAGST
ncbi:MAG: thermopsin, partial [Nitrososphaerota archaeon]|nr:thermopsin [Nitrososphaerota archaeon]